MDDRNRNRGKQKMPGAAAVIIIAVAAIAQGLGGVRGEYAVIIIFGIIVVAAIAFIALAVRKTMAANKEDKTPFAHSHDRLTNGGTVCDADDHWRNQLDGFLKAGIIDRNEYQVLLRRQEQQIERQQRQMERK